MTLLERVAADLTARGLRALIDHDMQLVVADCPDCHAQDGDPWRIWRPLQVVVRTGRLTYHCDACGIVAVAHV